MTRRPNRPARDGGAVAAHPWTLGVCLALAGVGLALASGAGASPLCRVTARVTPSHAVVGQQLVFDLRILRRHDVTELAWDRAPSFPAFRSEWLPGLSDEEPVTRDGQSYSGYHERRALFPARAGKLEIPPVALRCRSADSEEIVQTPGPPVLVETVPAEGRPADWSGVVGPVVLTATVTPTRVEVGRSVRISVVARGAANLWDARPPLAPVLDPLELAGALQHFPRPPELARDTGRGLQLRRYWAGDLVPRRAGRLDLRELRIAYFDPRRREYRIARTSLPSIEVVEAAPTAEPTPDLAPGKPLAPAPETASTGRLRPTLLALGLLAGGGAALALLRARRRAESPSTESIDGLLAEAESARQAGDTARSAERLGRALRRALDALVPGALALTPEEIETRAPTDDARRAAALLARVEEARFAPAGEAPPCHEVRACIAALGRGPD